MDHSATEALADVLQERQRQDEKFPHQQHPAPVWLTILGEEVGEASQAALHTQFGGEHDGRFREEMVQVAAVALAIVQAIDEGRCWHINQK
jgi:NTP pyrophosphatase (non-canonical NTP hydrolase)